MQDNTTFSKDMDTLFSDLHNFIKTDTVLGTPLPVGDKTLVPLMSVTLGYGSTGMDKKTNTTNINSNVTNGVGLGARVSTNGVIVIEKNSVSMLPVNEKGNTSMTQLIDKIPQVLSSLNPSSVQQGISQVQQNMQGQNTGTSTGAQNK